MHPIFYKRILVPFLIKERVLLFYIEELRITDRKRAMDKKIAKYLMSIVKKSYYFSGGNY